MAKLISPAPNDAVVLVHGTFARDAPWTREDSPMMAALRVKFPLNTAASLRMVRHQLSERPYQGRIRACRSWQIPALARLPSSLDSQPQPRRQCSALRATGSTDARNGGWDRVPGYAFPVDYAPCSGALFAHSHADCIMVASFPWIFATRNLARPDVRLR